MFGSVFSNYLRPVREAVGIYPGTHGLIYAHLCAPDRMNDVWTVSSLRRTMYVWTAGDDPVQLAGHMRDELARVDLLHLPLALALPETAAKIVERSLSAALTGEELRRALLWSLRAETGAEAPAGESLLCCSPLPDAPPHRYWTARISAARVRALYAAFHEAGLSLGRLTVCPPGGGTLADRIAAARASDLPWVRTNPETDASVDEETLPALYAGLLFRPDTPAALYWSGEGRGDAARRWAAAVIVLAAALVGAIASDLASYWATVHARDAARTELALHTGAEQQMEEEAALRADMEEQARLLGGFLSESRPWRALLIRLGTVAEDGVRLTAVSSEGQMLRMEGDAVHYAALTAMMARLQEDGGFPGDMTLERAEHEQGAAGEPAHVHFVLRAAWQSEV
jgi:hypothetical protein